MTIKLDKAYVRLRLDTRLSKFTAILLREPADQEVAAYEAARAKAYAEHKAKRGDKAGSLATFPFVWDGAPNLYALTPKKPFVEAKEQAIVLVEIPTGNYVVYGEGFGDFLYQCFCLGSVGFTAKPGVITDLGTMLFAFAAKPSDIPELAGETNLGPTAHADFAMFAVAIRPASATDVSQPASAGLVAEAARFRAIGPFVDPNTMHINRLAPIAGVLSYDGGRVIDVASGQEALPR